MSNLRVLVCHPGHSFSTLDVYDGLRAGLRMNGVDVIAFDWRKIMETMTALVLGAEAGGVVKPKDSEKLHRFLGWLAAADAIGMAVDSEVDAVIVVNGLLFPPTRAGAMRKLGIPIACFGTEAPYFLSAEQELAPFYTHFFTNERKCVGMFGDTPSFYLAHAWNPEKHTPTAANAAKCVPTVFVGGGYPERKAVIDGARAEGCDITTLGTLWHLDLANERGAKDLQRGSRYTERAITNEETTAWHQSAKIALNMHRKMTLIETGGEVAPGSATSLGPRAYEIPAVGGFMLSDDERPELREVYGESAATFRAWDSADLARQIRYWLANDERRERARAAQFAAVQDHHWGNRARYVLEQLFA